METICLYFETHQMIHLKRYRFFDIGTDHCCYGDFENERFVSETTERNYMSALDTLLQMIKGNGKAFKVALSLLGVGIEQLEMHAPQVLNKLQELNNTGCVELLTEPYSHGLASLANEESSKSEVKHQVQKIKEYFGQTPKILRNSSFIYSDDISLVASQMGFKGMLTEGAKHVLGWKGPHYVYNCALAPNLKLLLRDVKLSGNIPLRFSNSDRGGYPLFVDTYVAQIVALPDEGQVVGIFINLSALGIKQPLSSNISEFFKALSVCAKQQGITFSAPTEICMKLKSIDSLYMPDTLSWMDEECDVSTWLGNPTQREAFNRLYSTADRICIANDPRINQDQDYLQANGSFRFMPTRPPCVEIGRDIYDSPFGVFTNYMNTLGGFLSRVDTLYPAGTDSEESNNLLTTIHNQGDEIETGTNDINNPQAKVDKLEVKGDRLCVQLGRKSSAKKVATSKAIAKKPAKKTSAKKAVKAVAEEVRAK